MRDFLMDVRYAARMARGSPALTAAVVLSLGLAIGGNTAVFSVVQAVLLRPLPFRDPDRLVWVWEKNPRDDRPRNQVSWATFAAVRDESGVFEDIGASTDLIANLAGEQPPETVIGYRFSANFFRVLGTEPILGRTFLPGEDAAGRDHVVVLSHALWQRRFAGDPAVVGRMLRVNGEAHTVIGVMPPAFQHPPFVQIWKPLVLETRLTEEPSARFLRVVGRLRPGVSVAETGARVQAMQARLGGRYPDSHRGWGSLVAPIRSRYTDDVRPALVTLMGAMAFVFLIACANVAHLLLARTAARHREVAIRAAMGAGIALALAAVGLYGVISFSVTRRTREIGVRMALGARRTHILAMVVRQGLAVALTGVAIGIAAALAVTRVMGSLLFGVSPTDATSLGAVVALLVTVALVASYVPGRRATRVDPVVALRNE